MALKMGGPTFGYFLKISAKIDFWGLVNSWYYLTGSKLFGYAEHKTLCLESVVRGTLYLNELVGVPIKVGISVDVYATFV